MGFTPHENQNEEVSDAEVDALYEKFGQETDGPTISEDTQEIASATPDVTETLVSDPQLTKNQETVTKPATPQLEPEHEFSFNGQTIRAPLSKILKWAQQGYDYPQQMAKINQRSAEITGIEQTYKPIDEWVRANPDKWERLQAVIHAEQQGYGDLPADHPVLKKLQEVDSFISELKNEKLTAQHRQEDQALDQEIKSIQEKYKDLDWASVDADGRTREQKVLSHASQHGFKTFKTAFLDLYHEDLIKSAETKARESYAATKEREKKSGLLGKSQALDLKPAQKTKTQNYESTESILRELGIR